jgi:hypothetical protein
MQCQRKRTKLAIQLSVCLLAITASDCSRLQFGLLLLV